MWRESYTRRRAVENVPGETLLCHVSDYGIVRNNPTVSITSAPSNPISPPASCPALPPLLSQPTPRGGGRSAQSGRRHRLGENVDELALPVREGHVKVTLELALHHLERQVWHVVRVCYDFFYLIIVLCSCGVFFFPRKQRGGI